MRKVNELVKRVRLARVHAHLIGHLKKEMPSVFGKEKKQAQLISNMEDVFLKVHRANQLPVGDFPDVNKFRGSMAAHDISKFPKFNKDLVDVRAGPPGCGRHRTPQPRFIRFPGPRRPWSLS